MTTANNNHLPLVHQGASLKTWDDVKSLVADWYLGDLEEWMRNFYAEVRPRIEGDWHAYIEAQCGVYAATPRAAVLALKAKMEGE